MIGFLAIGAQKCATSWLYYCLQDHPELQLPKHKREVEYIGGDLYRQRGIEWYFDLWEESEPGQVKGDVSIEYLFNPQSPKLIHEHLGDDVNFIVSLRNPVDRARSAYYWYQRKGEIPENISLEQALQRGIKRCNNIEGAYAKNDIYIDLIARAQYYSQLQHYLEYFPRENFFFIIFDDIQKDALSVVQQIYRYLGVADDFVPSSVSKKPKKNSYFSSLLSLERKVNNNRIISAAIDRLNQYLSIAGITSDKQELSDDLEVKMKEIYREDINQLSKLLENVPPPQRTTRQSIAERWDFKSINHSSLKKRNQ